MVCSRCNSNRVLSANAKCSDLFDGSLKTFSYRGYVPEDLGIGGGDYVEFDLCLDCGQMQGDWPLHLSKKEINTIPYFDVNAISKSAKDLYQYAIDCDGDVFKVLEKLFVINDLDIFVEFFNAIFSNKYLKSSGSSILDYLKEWDQYEELIQRLNLDEDSDDYN